MITALDFDKLIEKEKYFGLDISSTRVKAMMVTPRRGGRMRLDSFGEVKIPASAIVGGIVRRPDMVVKAIKEVLKSTTPKPIKIPYAICSIPQEKVFLKLEEFPNLEKEKLREAITWKIKTILAMPLDEIYWDWHRIDWKEDSDTVTVLIAAVEKGVVDSYAKAVVDAGIIPLAFEIEASSAIRTIFASLKEEIRDKPLLLVDIGNSNTNLAIYDKGGLRFISSVNVGGNQLTKIVSTVLNVTPEEAEEYKRTEGLKSKSEDLVNALHESLGGIEKEIRGAISFYDKTPEKTDDIEHILVYGDGAVLKDLNVYWKNTSFQGIDCRYANPRVPIVPMPQFVAHRKLFPHIVVTGLALYGNENYKFKDLNFLPTESQGQYVGKQIKDKLNRFMKIFFVNSIGLMGFLFGSWFLLTQNAKEIQASIDTKKAVLTSQRIQEISQEVEDVNASLVSVSAIINSSLDWPIVFDDLAGSIPSGISLDGMDVYLDDSTKAGSEPTWLVLISGTSDTRLRVIEFSDNLVRTGLFEDVDIPVEVFSSSNEIIFQIMAKIKFTSLLTDPEGFKSGLADIEESGVGLELIPFDE